MRTMASNNWYETNQRYLSAALDDVRHALEQHCTTTDSTPQEEFPSTASTETPDQTRISSPPALETLCATFGLSPFERDIVLLCTGIELDSTFASLCASVQGNDTRSYPTFSLALATLNTPHWSALTPNAPLRYWQLVEIGSGNGLTNSPLRIDESILHYLVGMPYMDERLVGVIEPVRTAGDIVPSHYALAERLVAIWSQATGTVELPAIQLYGHEVASKRAIAATACDIAGLKLRTLSGYAIPRAAHELDTLIRRWEREAALNTSALFLDCDDLNINDETHISILQRVLERMQGALILSSHERWHTQRRPVIPFEVRKPPANEQRSAWQNALGPVAQILNGHIGSIVSQFSLSATTIQVVSTQIVGTELSDATNTEELRNALWDACRIQARPRLDDLAQRIEPVATWDNLVLPEQQRQALHDIAMHVRQRSTVYETWGFASRSARGMGISALFSGASGTGKTMAAEVIANELRLDLHHIDLSQMVSKYIGETEKNLRRIFDAAEDGGTILLFDEADALFGKRSEIKDSHDRYANIEVSYLLQRMEAYRGLAILTTNMKSALDVAFLRRIRFVVQFPFPDAAQRAEIWRCIFPTNTPTDGLDAVKLARLNVAGGNIRNIALNAAFLAADKGEPVRMTHLLRAARSECAKLEKSLTDAEVGGWI